MTIHTFLAKDTKKEESPASESSAKQNHAQTNYLTGQLPATELPLENAPILVTVTSTSTSDVLKEYSDVELPLILIQDTSDPRVFNRTHSSAVSSHHPLRTNDSDDASTSQSQSVMTSVIPSQSRDQIRKELNQHDAFITILQEVQDAEAVNWIRKSADQGHADAQFNAGLMYAQGRGVKHDDAEAVKWYRKAADQDDADAQCNLGVMYEQGQGVERNQTEAVKWYRKAADQGHIGAQFNVGLMYEHGRGVKHDDAEAVKWYRKAADQGHIGAQFNVGLMYAQGRGVKHDDAEAVNWIRKAADQGHADAQCNLGLMYAQGQGVKHDDAEAVKWYRKAAEHDHTVAQLRLASIYLQGLGVKKDVLEATYWWLRSVVDGSSREIFLDGGEVVKGFYSDVIQCIPAALTTFPEFKFIKTINFQKIELFNQDFLSVGQMIRANPDLEGLNFEDQEIDDAEAMILSQSLAFNTTLTELIFDEMYYFDASIFNEIKASLAQNVVIAELREHMKNHPITRSDELPLEVLDIIVDDMIVKASKAGKTKEATITAIDEFLLSVSRETLKKDLKI